MTIQERRFVNEYIESFDDKRSQKAAGITPYDPTLLNRPDINRMISEKTEQLFSTLDITDEYIVSRIKDVVESASRPIPKIKIDKDGNQIFYQTQDGNTIFERDYSSELKGLELLGRYRALFKDNQKVDLTTDFEKYINTAQDKEEW